MLKLSQTLQDRSILSLRTGKVIAKTSGVIIHPDTFKIEGLYCIVPGEKVQKVLVSQDIRDMITQGIVVNDIEVLSDSDELVRLHKVLSINYDPLGKRVVDVNHRRIGKVSDYSYDTEGLYIQKIYVTQNIFKNLNGGNLGVDRSQINEVTDKKIIIKELQPKIPAGLPVPS